MSMPAPPDHLHAVPEPEPDTDPAGLPQFDLFGLEIPASPPQRDSAPTKHGAALYIDADNQSAQLVTPLLNALTDNLKVPITRVTIAGNNAGKQIDQWRTRLSAADPDLDVHILDVPTRKDAADIALILELGASLEWAIHQQQLLIIMSRDEILIGAAEQAKARGARVMLAYADSRIPSSGNAELTTLLLPTVTKPQANKPPAALPKPTQAITADKMSTTVPKVDKSSVNSVLAGLRQMCPEQPGGGYQSTHVGQALQKFGFDAKARKTFLASVPNLGTRGKAQNKVLLF